MDIRQSQTAIQNSLVEIVNHLRAGSAGAIRSPSAFPYLHPSPNIHADSPASMSTPVSARPSLDTGHAIMTTPQPGPSVRPSASASNLRPLILLNRCIPVLPWPPCGQTATDKPLRFRMAAPHTSQSIPNIICLLVSILLRCRHYLA
jgi:hypothetical protein